MQLHRQVNPRRVGRHHRDEQRIRWREPLLHPRLQPLEYGAVRVFVERAVFAVIAEYRGVGFDAHDVLANGVGDCAGKELERAAVALRVGDVADTAIAEWFWHG